LGKVVGNLDVLEPIERRDAELGSGDVGKRVDFIDRVDGSLDSVVDRRDVALDRRPEIAKSGLDEARYLEQEG
jgi:hypothetical protein